MNNQQKTEIASLRSQGYGYARTAQALGLSKNTVKSYCRRNHLAGDAIEGGPDHPLPAPAFCLECGKPIKQEPGRKEKKFCSDECRHKWWNAHPEKITRKAVYSYTCAGYGKPFTAYGNAGRKYCFHDCYIRARFKGDSPDSGGGGMSALADKGGGSPPARRVADVSDETFEAELLYESSLSIAKSLLSKGLLNEEEYGEIDTKLRAEYGAKFSTLLSR